MARRITLGLVCYVTYMLCFYLFYCGSVRIHTYIHTYSHPSTRESRAHLTINTTTINQSHLTLPYLIFSSHFLPFPIPLCQRKQPTLLHNPPTPSPFPHTNPEQPSIPGMTLSSPSLTPSHLKRKGKKGTLQQRQQRSIPPST